MRVIKFRAWDGENMMTNLDCLQLCELENNCYQNNEGNLVGCTFMQFTGLTDKSGVDIYEEHELNNSYGVRFVNGRYVLYYISSGDIFMDLNEATINGYELKITGEYTKI